MQSATRGDGQGENVTANVVRAVKDISEIGFAASDFPEVFGVRGEIYMAQGFGGNAMRNRIKRARTSLPIREMPPRDRCASLTHRSPPAGPCASLSYSWGEVSKLPDKRNGRHTGSKRWGLRSTPRQTVQVAEDLSHSPRSRSEGRCWSIHRWRRLQGQSAPLAAATGLRQPCAALGTSRTNRPPKGQ